MQLSWREGDSLAKILPMDVDWDPIHRGGSNGLSLIVMALLWWIKLTNTGNGPNKVLSGAISDLMWVLSELVSANLNIGNKHACESNTKDKPKSKRCVLIILFQFYN